MHSIPWDTLRAEVLALYRPPLRSAATYRIVKQVLRELAEVPMRDDQDRIVCEDGRPRRVFVESADLTAANVGRWVREFMHHREKRSGARMNALLRTLSPIATWAVTSQHLASSPFDFRKPGKWVRSDIAPRKRSKSRPKLHRSADEIGRLLAMQDAESCDGAWESGRLQSLIYFYAFTGVRKCEALELMLEDVDLPARRFTIRPKEDWRPKTERSSTVLPIVEPLADVLARWLPRCGGTWVFPGRKQRGPWTGGSPGYKPLDQIRAAGERAGIQGLTILSFRKTLGTLAKSWGVTQLELKALLRHTNIDTQKFYDEEDLELLQAAASKIRFPRVASTG